MKLEEEIQQTKFRSPAHKATLNVIFTAYWLEERAAKALKPFGISEQQFNILRILRGQKGNPLNLYMIQARMLHKMSNVTRLVEKLRLKGHVERNICPGNRRAVEIVITDKGMELLAEIDRMMEKEGFGNSPLSGEEAETLSMLLDKMRG